MNLTEVEENLLRLVKGRFSNVIITWDEFNTSYQNVEVPVGIGAGMRSWVNDSEQNRAKLMNRIWIVEWYSNTAVGPCAVFASTLTACLDGAFKIMR